MLWANVFENNKELSSRLLLILGSICWNIWNEKVSILWIWAILTLWSVSKKWKFESFGFFNTVPWVPNASFQIILIDSALPQKNSFCDLSAGISLAFKIMRK